MWHTWGVFLVLYILGTMYTLVAIPRATANFEEHPWAVVIVLLNVLAIANIPRSVHLEQADSGFRLIDPDDRLSGVPVWNRAVPELGDGTQQCRTEHADDLQCGFEFRTRLRTMFIIVLIGLPFVLTYTAAVYWTFRGRVELGEHSY